MNAESVLRTLTAAVIVLGTWGLWAWQVYAGLPVNALLFTLVIVMTLAAVRVVFGAGAFAQALDALESVRAAAEANTTSGSEESVSADADAPDSGEGGE